nr:RNA-directed DNA polymerase, eukaryota, reverse transcriptase zinc-binding domain protein [Tanacetum cinerariifolium]
KKRTNIEQAVSGSDPLFPLGFTLLNLNQLGNEAVENVAHEELEINSKTWSIQKKSIREHDRRVIQDYLLEIDSRLNKGEVLPNNLPNRSKTFHDIDVIDHKISVDMAQKAKQAIKGILIDGKWIDNPDRVKREFYNHFTNIFSDPDWSRVPMEGIFPRRLGADSFHDLEGDVSFDEIKKAVWDCGSDKSQGHNGFTFEDQALLFKVDFQKTFDSVRWDHLDDILGVHSSDIQSMANSFGCLENNLPFTYLGVKVAANMARINSWNEVIQKVSGLASSNLFTVGHFRSQFIKQSLVLNLRVWISGVMQESDWMLQLRKSSKIHTLPFLFKDVLEVVLKSLNFRSSLSLLLSSFVLSSFSDRWSWTLNGHGDFSVKSAREEIDKHLLVSSSSSTRWSKLLPIKLNVFAWRMFLGKLPIRFNLSNKGLDIPCVLCPNCGNVVESRNHFFFGCSMALDLFWLFGRWWNIDIINLIDHFSWESWFNDVWLNNIRKLALEALFFSMWWHT